MIAGSLAAISILWGLLTFWVFRRFTNHIALRRVRKLLYAHLLEIRLFAEEPALVWKAQKSVVMDNVRFLSLIAKPVLILALPFAALYTTLDSIYAWAPLQPGHSSVVTIQTGNDSREPDLVPPQGIVVETPPVHVTAEHQMSWRIRALAPAVGTIRLGSASISVVAGDQLPVVKHRHASTSDGGWIEVAYPKSQVKLAGISLPWLAWFMILSALSAAIFAKTFSPRFVVDNLRFQA